MMKTFNPGLCQNDLPDLLTVYSYRNSIKRKAKAIMQESPGRNYNNYGNH